MCTVEGQVIKLILAEAHMMWGLGFRVSDLYALRCLGVSGW